MIVRMMNSTEKKKLIRLTEKHAELQKKMEKAQSAYTQAWRKNSKDPKLNKLANEGFKYELKAYKAKEALQKYTEMLLKKYK